MAAPVGKHEPTEEPAGENPGAAPFGNFPNYYCFNPPGARLLLLGTKFRDRLPPGPLLGLDVGCNSGDLSVSLYRLLVGFQPEEVVHTMPPEDPGHIKFLCCDIDPTLIKRAKASNPYTDSITYCCLDIMNAAARQEVLGTFVARFGCSVFDIGFCMSVTMWIHLNYGDNGLVEFLTYFASTCKYLLIEPQPWKCYRSAARRLRKLGRNDFDHFRTLKITGDMSKRITDILTKQEGVELICSFGNTSWDRDILLFKSNKLIPI